MNAVFVCPNLRPPGRDSADVEELDSATGTTLYVAQHSAVTDIQAVLNELGYAHDKCWPCQTLAAMAVTVRNWWTKSVTLRNHGVSYRMYARNKQLHSLSTFTSGRVLQDGCPLSRRLASHPMTLPLPWQLIQFQAIKVFILCRHNELLLQMPTGRITTSEHCLSAVKVIDFRSKGATQVNF